MEDRRATARVASRHPTENRFSSVRMMLSPIETSTSASSAARQASRENEKHTLFVFALRMLLFHQYDDK